MRFMPTIRCRELSRALLICEACWRGWGIRTRSEWREFRVERLWRREKNKIEIRTLKTEAVKKPIALSAKESARVFLWDDFGALGGFVLSHISACCGFLFP